MPDNASPELITAPSDFDNSNIYQKKIIKSSRNQIDLDHFENGMVKELIYLNTAT